MSFVFGMHIMEGFLPMKWAALWSIAALPFIIAGCRQIAGVVREEPKLLALLAFAGAFVFVLSSLKMPSVTGSCSHPTGVGLGAILFGPGAMVILGMIVLLFQALLLAHGGITTLGANVFSMAIVGPFVAYGVYRLMSKLGAPQGLSVFSGAALGSLITYLVTAAQLALAHPAEVGGFYASLVKFAAIFGVTQIPISIAEGLLTVMVMNLLMAYSRDEIESLSLLRNGGSIHVNN